MMRWVVMTAVLLAPGPMAWQAAAPAAQPPPPVTPSPEEVARLQLEAHLKELQRRLEFDNPDAPARERLLRAIIDDCIELGRDYTPYQQKLKETQGELRKQAADAARTQQYQKAADILKQKALQAMRSVPPRWSDAAAALADANRLVPNDPQTLAWKATADLKLQQQRTYVIVLGSLLALATTGVGLAAFKALKKRAQSGTARVRRLEMMEGPQAGESFQLEKDITTLGAVAVESDWAIPDPSHRMSRRHCDIGRSGRHYFLTDYSSNGTFINGKRVPKGEPVLLRKGDRIALTDEIVLRFR